MSDKITVPKIAGVIYKKLGRRKAFALVEPGEATIIIDKSVKGRKELEMFIHEGLHIVAPFLDEEYVTGMGAELARVMWAAGFRKTDQDASVPMQDELKSNAGSDGQ